MKPRNKFMIIEPIEEGQKKTDSGIYLPEMNDSVNDMLGKAVVIAIDEKSETKCVDVGEKILYMKAHAHLINPGKKQFLITDENVLAVL